MRRLIVLFVYIFYLIIGTVNADVVGSKTIKNDIPDKPNESIFIISFADTIATVKFRNSTNKNCDVWYSIEIVDTTENNERKDIGKLTCNDKFKVGENLTRGNIHRVEIKACNNIGCSSPFLSKDYRNDIASGNLEDLNIGGTWVDLQINFDMDRTIENNYLFVIENVVTSTFRYTDSVLYSYHVGRFYVFVYDLTPNIDYKCRVVLKNNGTFFESRVLRSYQYRGVPYPVIEEAFYVLFANNKASVAMKERFNIYLSDWLKIDLLHSVNNNIIESSNLTWKDSSVHFNNLRKNDSYRLQFTACNKFGCSKPIVSRKYQSGESKINMKVLNVTETSCTVQWTNLTNSKMMIMIKRLLIQKQNALLWNRKVLQLQKPNLHYINLTY
ncbi:uncharacterized protein LOC122504552 isoform X2 [Leptopilina heterotoma]|uniref:uncharacterized protein LOC122504552 isoform X2 n=1 Tax=Leptopilina heterotoma TaxID=63436 RepID=UPI001CA91D82|nr:uncharacterized protein LOC122504552 isoform X2 [Leptopilina heterotoma]